MVNAMSHDGHGRRISHRLRSEFMHRQQTRAPTAHRRRPAPSIHMLRTLTSLTLPWMLVACAVQAQTTVPFKMGGQPQESVPFKDTPGSITDVACSFTIRSIGWSKGSKVVAVFATGYYRQVVAGLPEGTPVVVSSYEEQQPCGYAYLGGDNNLGWINPKAREVFGVEATSALPPATGSCRSPGHRDRERASRRCRSRIGRP